MDITKLFQLLDKKAEERLKTGQPVSCKRGCHACCRLSITIVKQEADLISEFLIKSNQDLMRLSRRLEKSARLMTRTLNRFDYLSLEKDCVFLDSKKDCSIYDVRPSACRYHYVVSPPEDCSILDRSSTITAVNLMDLEAIVWRQTFEQDKIVTGPLPLIVLDSLAEKSNNKFIKSIRSRLPSVEDWMEEAINSGEFFQGSSTEEKQAVVNSVLGMIDADPNCLRL